MAGRQGTATRLVFGARDNRPTTRTDFLVPMLTSNDGEAGDLVVSNKST
jgi:hypothetical protein